MDIMLHLIRLGPLVMNLACETMVNLLSINVVSIHQLYLVTAIQQCLIEDVTHISTWTMAIMEESKSMDELALKIVLLPFVLTTVKMVVVANTSFGNMMGIVIVQLMTVC